MAGVGSKIYRFLIKTADPYVPEKLLPMWNHAAGPKTVFFWAPTVKWGLVIAGLADVTRPAEKLSFNQSATLAATVTTERILSRNKDKLQKKC